MSTVAFIKRLREKGWAWDQILEAAEAFEAETPGLESQLSLRQERNRRYYENRRLRSSDNKTIETHQDDSKTTGDPDPSPEQKDPTPQKTQTLSPPKTPLKGVKRVPEPSEDQPEKPDGETAEAGIDEPAPPRPRRRPSRPIPDDFPDAELIAAERDKALLAGFDLDAATEAERFRNHAHSTDRRCVDWTAAFRNWTLKARGWAPKIQAMPGPDADPWPSRLTRWNVAQYWNSDWGPKPGREGYAGPPVTKARAA